MAYNPPPTGHVVLILDNGTTAMTGQQEHPGTGRRLDHGPTNKLSIEGIADGDRHRQRHRHRSLRRPGRASSALLLERLATPELSVIVARRPCILAAADIRKVGAAGGRVRAGRPSRAFDLPMGDR
jgi:indolepyruvate ferredoxin oxidoreductase alpha subunit